MHETTRDRLLEVDGVDAGDVAAIDRAAAANDAAAEIDRQLAEAAPHRRGAESISIRWLAEFDGDERLLEYEQSHKWNERRPQRIDLLLETKTAAGRHEATVLTTDLALAHVTDGHLGTRERLPVVTARSTLTTKGLTTLLATAYSGGRKTSLWKTAAEAALAAPSTEHNFEDIQVDVCIRKPTARRAGWSAYACARRTCDRAIRTRGAEAKGASGAEAAGRATRAAIDAVLKNGNRTPAIGNRPSREPHKLG